MTVPIQDPSRKRKAHRKSRKGCGNCKLRRVKVGHCYRTACNFTDLFLQCDEKQPSCRKCIDYGVSCNYDPTNSDLQLTIHETSNNDSPPELALSFGKGMTSIIHAPLSPDSIESAFRSGSYGLQQHEFDLLRKFQTRTVKTLGTTRTSHYYVDEVFKLACYVS